MPDEPPDIRRAAAASGAAVPDSAGRDSAAGDGAGRDSAGRDSAGRDSAGRDSAARDSAARDSAARDSAARDSAARDEVVLTGMAVASACGRGTGPLLAAVLAGRPAFTEVTRFDVQSRRVRLAAQMSGSPRLADELAAVVGEACADAALDGTAMARSTLLLAAHADSRLTGVSGTAPAEGGLATSVARRCGMLAGPRVYTAACVAASTAVADAASMIAAGRLDRAVVAAGYLVDEVNFTLFDVGRALAKDGRVRPFSAGRQGMLLGDGVAAVVLESARAAGRRGARALATVAGWGRAGDAYHVCDPRPDGAGLARAVRAAMRRAAVTPSEVGYVNANGTGAARSDPAESAALRLAFGDAIGQVPVSSTKAVHGHALEASALLELVVTVLAVRGGMLPVNAGYLGPDADCELDLVLDTPRRASSSYGLTVNFAFGGANTALLVRAA
jgi:3-oxoacyl-(acyl-carrier-protein) synthase